VSRATVDLEHGVVYFDYVRLEPVVIMFIHALNPERDMHRGCTNHRGPTRQFSLETATGCKFGNQAVT
jgi:hypothetical protein